MHICQHISLLDMYFRVTYIDLYMVIDDLTWIFRQNPWNYCKIRKIWVSVVYKKKACILKTRSFRGEQVPIFKMIVYSKLVREKSLMDYIQWRIAEKMFSRAKFFTWKNFHVARFFMRQNISRGKNSKQSKNNKSGQKSKNSPKGPFHFTNQWQI